MIITENTTDNLQGVLAVYSNDIHFYPFENNNLQPYRAPIKEDLKQLINLVENNGIINAYYFDGIIPSNVLNFKTDEASIVWKSNAQKRKLFFADSLPMETSFYPIPNLIWKLENNNLFVFATTSNKITEDTILYQAPFLNVSKDGDVCMGNAMAKNIPNNLNDAIQELEYRFFNSYFTHTNTNVLTTKSIIDVYLEQKDQNAKTFDTNLLIKTELTLNDIL